MISIQQKKNNFKRKLKIKEKISQRQDLEQLKIAFSIYIYNVLLLCFIAE